MAPGRIVVIILGVVALLVAAVFHAKAVGRAVDRRSPWALVATILGARHGDPRVDNPTRTAGTMVAIGLGLVLGALFWQ